jgi:hypothetical protein
MYIFDASPLYVALFLKKQKNGKRSWRFLKGINPSIAFICSLSFGAFFFIYETASDVASGLLRNRQPDILNYEEPREDPEISFGNVGWFSSPVHQVPLAPHIEIVVFDSWSLHTRKF